MTYQDLLLSEQVNGRKYSCLMVGFRSGLKDFINEFLIDQIDIEDMSDIQDAVEEPHITVLYGLHTNSPEEIFSFTRDIKEIPFTIHGLSYFEHDDRFILKLDITSPALQSLNGSLKAMFPYTSSYSEYYPHITIAYLKKDVTILNKYMNMFNGHVLSSLMDKQHFAKSFIFSTAEDERFIRHI